MMRNFKHWAWAAALVAVSGTSQAALVDRGGGMIYDSTLNLTWLADMDYAQTSGHAGTGVYSTGEMTWDAANAWASSLNYGGFTGWRLPILNPSDSSCSDSYNPGGGFPLQYGGYNSTGGELSHLFVTDLGTTQYKSVLDPVGKTAEQLANLAMFSNVQGDWYLSGTEYALYPETAWTFDATSGLQFGNAKFVHFFWL